jgi:copper chaperone CopZ
MQHHASTNITPETDFNRILLINLSEFIITLNTQKRTTMLKNVFFVIMLASALMACNTAPKKDSATTKASKVQVNKTITLAVEGMTCEGCENTVKESVEKLPGISSAVASYKEKTAIVSFDSTLTKTEDISKAITDVGYEVKGLKLTVDEVGKGQ